MKLFAFAKAFFLSKIKSVHLSTKFKIIFSSLVMITVGNVAFTNCSPATKFNQIMPINLNASAPEFMGCGPKVPQQCIPSNGLGFQFCDSKGIGQKCTATSCDPGFNLVRDTFTDKTTIGKLYIDGVYQCETLEDTVRAKGVKVYGKTAIPRGEYEIVINFSEKYQRPMIQVMNVPMFEGIRVHSGNKAEDTEGCILVGTSRSKDWISGSVKAFTPLFKKIDSASEAGDNITITIT